MNADAGAPTNYIAGEWRHASSGARFASLDPATGREIATVADSGREDAVDAVDAAAGAFDAWSALTAYQRADHLAR
ncbi:MAG TPA: aldehyde dehydrogenase family protein, partial [Acidimicrobiales bacterium]